MPFRNKTYFKVQSFFKRRVWPFKIRKEWCNV
jgi:hypothetical protein